MAYQQSVRNEYQRADEIHAHRTKRSYLPLALLGALALGLALWAIARNRAPAIDDTPARTAPLVTPDDHTPTTTPRDTPGANP